MKLLGIVSVDLDVTGQLLIIYFAFIRYLRKNGNTIRQVHQQSVNFKKPYDQSGGRSCIIFSLSLVSLLRLIKNMSK